MADGVEGAGAGFWLPSEFFTDDDFLMDKANFKKNPNTESNSQFCFPTEFPYDFLETENEELLEKCWMMSTSPQSTLAHVGSWSSNGSPIGVPSPPTTPLGARNDAVGDAKLRLSGGDGLAPGPTKLRDLLGPPRSLAQLHHSAKDQNSSVFQNAQFLQHVLKQQNQGCEMWCRPQQMYQNTNGRAAGRVGQSAWSIQHDPTRAITSGPRSVLLGGSGVGAGGRGGGGGATVKRQCTGTGVFLPRRYGNTSDSNTYSSDSRKKPGCSTAFVQDRAAAAAHALIKNLDSAQSQLQPQPFFNRAFVSDYDSLMARKHVVMVQQHRQSVLLSEGTAMMSRDMMYLPQEWTY